MFTVEKWLNIRYLYEILENGSDMISQSLKQTEKVSYKMWHTALCKLNRLPLKLVYRIMEWLYMICFLPI